MIVPDGLTVAEKIKALGKQYKELSKRGDALKVYAELILEYDMERNAKALEKAKSEVEKSFSGFDVFKDMKDMGFDSGEIDKIFGDLPRTFDDIKKSIDKAYEGMAGEDAQREQHRDVRDQKKEYALHAHIISNDARARLDRHLPISPADSFR